jgi:hypothetical protein
MPSLHNDSIDFSTDD